LAGAIPAPLDRMEHLLSLATVTRDVSTALAKECLQDAFSISLGSQRDLAGQQRAIIDLADRIGEEFAQSLVSQMEDDPAIVRHRIDPIVSRWQINDLVRKFPAGVSDSDLHESTDGSAA